MNIDTPKGGDGTRRIAREARSPQILVNAGTASLHLTLAVCDYEHVRDLAHGVVVPDGITLTPLVFPSIEEITFRFTRNLEWDVSELSFGKYTSLASQGQAAMVAIPIFPSRVHRHSAIYVRADRGIRRPKDLEGRTIGIPEWAQTAGVYVRGFLSEHYGVDLSTIPRDSIERIEIIRGNSGAVLYGDNAVGGVINIVSKSGSNEGERHGFGRRKVSDGKADR